MIWVYLKIGYIRLNGNSTEMMLMMMMMVMMMMIMMLMMTVNH